MPKPASEDDIRATYHATIDDLYRFVSRKCDGDRDLAEDVTQETWLRAVKAWRAGGLPDSPQAWLTTVAKNLLANHFRRRPSEPFDEAIALPVVDDGADRAEQRQTLLARALARISIPHLKVLQAFHFRQQPVADIAAEEGLSERAVEGRLRRARQQLRHQIESDPDTEGDVT